MSPATDLRAPQRILIYGVTGSGKTTLAADLARRTGLPWHNVDELSWQPGWVEVPRDEQRRLFQSICREDRWILDTAYSHWRDVPLARAELIVGLDYPRWLSLARLVRRTVGRVFRREVVCNGNRETVRTTLSPTSILIWHFRSFGRKRALLGEWETDPSVPPVVRLTSVRETRRWVGGIGTEGPPV